MPLTRAEEARRADRRRGPGGAGAPARVWISNQRSRAAKLTPERVEQLSAIGMRWA
ncbi:helicase associated domain-containing protein [Streptomyces sp. NPDC101112]|uniref:helicase associated domain-containing protein n=1 Tax=Streptomyces sp. NPDC101112 TaxID=3366105 RepID=UPI00381C8164